MKWLLVLIISAVDVAAEEWDLSFDARFNLSQSAYSANWEGEEVGSISWTAGTDLDADRRLTSWIETANYLKLEFGQTLLQDSETRKWLSPVKSADRIEAESTENLILDWLFHPFVSARVESRFLDLRDSARTLVLNPTTFTESFGAAQSILEKGKTEWNLRLGPGFRQFLDLRGVSDTSLTTFSHDLGFLLVTDFKTSLVEDRISLSSRLSVYEALYYSEADESEDLPGAGYWRYPDADWNATLSAGIIPYLTLDLDLRLLYDRQVSRRERFKQTLSLGLSYEFI